MSEGPRHAEIRKQIENDFKGKVDLRMSHEKGTGEIAFYKGAARREDGLSRPDILITDGKRALIIEIETSTRPKLLLGVAGANYYADYAEQSKEQIDIRRKSMLFVLPSEEIDKTGSQKRAQMDELKRFVKEHYKYEHFDIINELEACDAINRWLEVGR